MKKLLAIAMTLVLAGMLVHAQETPPSDGAEGEQLPASPEVHVPERHGGPGRVRQRNPEAVAQIRLERLRSEISELKAMYDENQDGVLDEAERAKLDADLAIAERLENFVRLAKILKQIDVDRDYEISDEEAKQIPQAMNQLRPAGGQGMRRGGPGGRPQGVPGRRHGGPRGESRGDEERPPLPPTLEE